MAGITEAPWYLGLLVLLGAMLLCGLVGFTIERLAYKPLRNAPRLNVLITAIGVSLFLQNVGQLPGVFGTKPRALQCCSCLTPSPGFTIGQVHKVNGAGRGRGWARR